MDAPEGPGLVLNPCPYLYLVLIVTGISQGNVNTIHLVGVILVESMTLFLGQEIQTSHIRVVLVDQETQMIHTKSLGWKEVVLGEKVANILLEACRLINIEDVGEGGGILVLYSLVDSVSANLKLYLIGRFVFFHAPIEMVRKWVSQRWKLKGPVMVLGILGGLFLFKFKASKDMKMVRASPY